MKQALQSFSKWWYYKDPASIVITKICLLHNLPLCDDVQQEVLKAWLTPKVVDDHIYEHFSVIDHVNLGHHFNVVDFTLMIKKEMYISNVGDLCIKGIHVDDMIIKIHDGYTTNLKFYQILDEVRNFKVTFNDFPECYGVFGYQAGHVIQTGSGNVYVGQAAFK